MKSFLENRKTQHANNYNYQSIRDSSKYIISEDELDTFFDLYRQEPNPAILERIRPDGHISVRCDVDIKLPLTIEPNGFYLLTEIERVAEIYREVLRKKVKGITEEQLVCYVLEKKEPTILEDEGKHKKGFHLEFTKLFLHKTELKQIILPSIEKECKESNLFSRWSEYMKEIIDAPAVCTTPWCLYGSVKKTGEPYRITKMIGSEGEFLDYTEPCVEEFLINPKGSKVKFIRDCIQDISIQQAKLQPLPYEEKREYAIPKTSGELLRQANELAVLIDSSMTDYHKWWNCGQALFDMTNGSLDGFELWLKLSAKAPNFKESSCINQWNKMKPKGWTIGVLRNLAKQDNPKMYLHWNKAKSRHVIMESIRRDGELTSTECAKALFLLYQEFLYCNTSKKFFHFNGVRWTDIDMEGHELRNKIEELEIPIMNEVKRIREQQHDLEMERKEKEDQNEDPSDEQKKIKKLDKERSLLMKEKLKLKDTPFRGKIMKECKDIFLDREFDSKKDKNTMLIGFNNGILDLIEGFRQGRKEDYITFTTGYDYIECTNPAVDEYFSQVFIKEEIKYYVFNYLASLLQGRNTQKKLLFWTGVGDNSKSILEKLIKMSFGQYAGLLPVSYFVGKKQGATTEINRVKDCRIVFTNEPSNKDVLDIGLLKELTGNDEIQTRKLFNESDKATDPMQFKLVVLCNKLPQIQSDDVATWNRIRVVDFESRFIDCTPTKENEFQKKLDFCFTVEFQQAFMTMLYKIYKKGYDHYEPEQVKSATAKFQGRNDTVRSFINQILVEDESVSTTIGEAWSEFQSFFKNQHPTTRLTISQSDFLTNIKNHFKDKLQGNVIQGIRLRTQEDETKEEIQEDEEDGDTKKWILILEGYKKSETSIPQKTFLEEHKIHPSLGRKKFPEWFKKSGYKLESKGKKGNILFIEKV